MTAPKRKYPSARKNARRSHHHLFKPALVSCSQCKQPKLNHQACPNCGTYNGRTILQLETPGRPRS